MPTEMPELLPDELLRLALFEVLGDCGDWFKLLSDKFNLSLRLVLGDEGSGSVRFELAVLGLLLLLINEVLAVDENDSR